MNDDEFERAQAEVKQLPHKPSNEELLALYGLFKQATVGDNTNKRPGAFDFKGRAKHDAWLKCAGQPGTAARAEYVALVSQLKSKYGS